MTTLTTSTDTLEQSKQQIKIQVDAELSAALNNQSIRLKQAQELFAQQEQQAIHENDFVTQELNELELEWESHDKSQSGTTTLGTRISKFEKVLKAEEASISRDCEKLNDLDIEIRTLATEVVGQDDYDRFLAGTVDWTIPSGVGVHDVPAEIEAERARYAKLLEDMNKASMKAMRESEDVIILSFVLIYCFLY